MGGVRKGVWPFQPNKRGRTFEQIWESLYLTFARLDQTFVDIFRFRRTLVTATFNKSCLILSQGNYSAMKRFRQSSQSDAVSECNYFHFVFFDCYSPANCVVQRVYPVWPFLLRWLRERKRTFPWWILDKSQRNHGQVKVLTCRSSTQVRGVETFCYW